MATNRDMLKEAIAEAKAIKETAIANAKLALEEAFTPQMKSILSAKIEEMAREDEAMEESYDEMDEALGTINDPDGPTAHGNVAEEMEEEVDLDELLREIEAEEMDENITEAKEEEEETEEEEEEEEEEEGEPLNLEDMTDEDLKKMIEDVIADMVSAGELEAGEGKTEEEDMNLDMDNMEELDEEFNLESLLNEIENEGTTPVKEEVVNTLTANFLYALEAIDMIKAGTPDEEIIAFLNKNIKFEGNGNAEELFQKIVAKHRPNSDEKKYPSLEEAHNTINTLRTELNEINLLNAKLLYTNKIFKSKNLNESQKVKVLSSFDKAKSVSEVKIVFETLNEGLTVKPTNTIRENLGSASKATVTPKVTTKQPIIESNDAFARMRALAFYNSKH
jgi:hypothetical protein